MPTYGLDAADARHTAPLVGPVGPTPEKQFRFEVVTPPSSRNATRARRHDGGGKTQRKTDTRRKAPQPTGAHSRGWARRRAAWAPYVNTGTVACWRCGTTIRPGEAWDLGHRVATAHGGRDDDARPEHRHRTGDCPGNPAAGASIRRPPRETTRQW